MSLNIPGFVLTLAGLILGGALFIVGFLSLGLSTLFATAWYSVYQGQNIFTKLKKRVQEKIHQKQEHQLQSQPDVTMIPDADNENAD